MPSILILGLNPSASLTLSFSSSSPLTLGAVNRASSAHNSAGGKGQNTALALHTWLHRSDNAAACHSIDKDKSNDLSSKNEWNLRIVQTLGSTTGSQVSQRLLNACHLISQRTIELPFATRTTVTLIDSQSGQVTELIEPNSGTISAEHAEQIRREIETGVEGADALIMMGTVPPGLDSVAIYADAARVYKEKSEGKGLVFMDTSKGVVETVDKAKGAIDCVKINLDEAIDILSKMGENVEGDGEERGKKVAKRLAKRLDGVKLLGITDGPRCSYLVHSATTTNSPDSQPSLSTYRLPALPKPLINPIGAGDTVAAVFLASLLQGSEPEIAFADGLAAGCASCLTVEAAGYSIDDFEQLKRGVVIETEAL